MSESERETGPESPHWKALGGVGPQTLWVRTTSAWRKADLTGNRQRRPGLRSWECITSAKLTEADIPVIFRRYAAGESCASIAPDFGVTYGTIHKVVSGRTWKHIEGAPGSRSYKGASHRGSASSFAKLTPDQVRAVEELALRRVCAREIGRRFGVHGSTVRCILMGLSYQGVAVLRGQYSRPVHPGRKLTDQQAGVIRQRYAAGETKAALAACYGVSRETIGKILRGKTYRPVTP